MHRRRQLLNDLRDQLKAIPGYAGPWLQRIAPMRNLYPALTLYAESEQIETLTINESPRICERSLAVSITAWIRSAKDLERPERDMDDAAGIIETTLQAPADITDMMLLNTEFQIHEDDDDVVYAVTLTYQLIYITNERQPLAL